MRRAACEARSAGSSTSLRVFDVRGAVLVALLAPAAAFAQAPPPSGRIEISAGFRGVAPVRFEPAAATETTRGGGTLTVFETRSQLEASPGAVVRVGVHLRTSWWLESALAVNASGLVTRVTRDRDTAPTAIRESLAQFAFEGAVLRRIERKRTARVTPFLSAGGGFIRHLHDGRTLAESGWSAHAGGGIHYLLSHPVTSPSPAGLRLDARAMVLPSGIALDGRSHVAPLFEATLFVRF